MATGNTLSVPDLWEGARDNPLSMVKEVRSYGASGAGGKRRLLRATRGQDTEATYEFMVSHLYSAATGLTANILFAAELPIAAGSAVLEASFERLASNVAGSVINADSWGTPVAVTTAVPTVGGRVVYATIAVPKANFGGGTGASLGAHELCRMRLRRLSLSSAADTVAGDVLILGVEIQET
jgi:hypothetical protein